MKKRDLVLLIGCISFILFVVSLSLLLGDHFETKTCGCPKMISQNFIWLFIILSIVFVSSLIYYLFSLKIEQKDRCVLKNLEILDSILDNDEKKVLDILIKNNGSVRQVEISKEYDKTRAYRIIKKLEDKRIIEVSRGKKENIICLNEELKRELIK